MKKSFFHQILLKILIILILMLGIPYTITMLLNGTRASSSTTIPYDGRIVVLEDLPLTPSLDYSQYLSGMVARLLISFDETVFESPEFIRLNCLIANTLLTEEFKESNMIRENFLSTYYISENDLKTLWKEEYPQRMDMINSMIRTTKNQVLTHNGNLIKPFYHFISNGMTRACDTSDTYPYLKSVKTNQDLEEPGFLCVNQLNNEDFIRELQSSYPDFHLPDAAPAAGLANVSGQDYTSLKENIQITQRDPYGYVAQIQIGNLLLSGDEFMNLFDLKSTSFTFSFQEKSLKIITKGVGHGYGISLSYALSMAKSGSTAEDILEFFYENVEIKSLE